MTSLHEHLLDSEPEPAIDEHYRIGDRGRPLNEAAWAERKLIHYRSLQDEISLAGQLEIERITEWMTTEVARHQGAVDYFTGLLLELHRRQLADAVELVGGDWSKVEGKTRHLPGGTRLVARKAPDRWVYPDEEEFVLWAGLHHPELLTWPERPAVRPDRTKIKAALTVVNGQVLDGDEIVPGVKVEAGEVEYSIGGLT